ncbi:uncharacterized protein [Cardiocondyla obscurior]|uniref:uncharacterized protein isoform X2 n=1 Tax=Cardiocondyla obscurior TaxID=286306 RepID=UPI0039656F42
MSQWPTSATTTNVPPGWTINGQQVPPGTVHTAGAGRTHYEKPRIVENRKLINEESTKLKEYFNKYKYQSQNVGRQAETSFSNPGSSRGTQGTDPSYTNQGIRQRRPVQRQGTSSSSRLPVHGSNNPTGQINIDIGSVSDTVPLLGTAGSTSLGSSGVVSGLASAGGALTLGGITAATVNRVLDKGAVLPGTDYVGPGNKINIDAPRHESDAIAKEHDIAYDRLYKGASASKNSEDERYAQFEKAIRSADKEAIQKFKSHWDREGKNEEQFDIDTIVNQPHPDERRVIDELDESHSNAEDPDKILAQLPDAAESDIQDFDESHFESNSQSLNNQHDNNMASQSGIPMNGPPSKRARTESQMKLTGTAKDQGKNGQPTADSGVRAFKLPHPSSDIHSYVRYYRKIHRIFTFGLAYKPILDPTGFPKGVYMTTPLCEVPWNRPFWYINESEFNILPNGSSISSCGIKICQRNVRVAFPTNSTASNLATLNQNKNIIYSIGLNKNVDCLPVEYSSFDDSQPMVPTGIKKIKDNTWNALYTEMYGNINNHNDTMPRHQFGQPMMYNIYAAIANVKVAETGSPYDGWQCVQNYYTEVDADHTSGTYILEEHYKPRCGMIKYPITAIQRAYTDGDIEIPRGSHNLQPHTTQINIKNREAELVTQRTDQCKALTSVGDISRLIEKCAYIKYGLFEHGPPIAQPSIHVGVQPTYALSTPQLVSADSNQNFTDTQALFEIVAECEINTAYPTHRPGTKETNVPFDEQYFFTNQYIDSYSPMIAGQYIKDTSV